MPSFSTLPPELHLKIVSHLPESSLCNVSRVCKAGAVHKIYDHENYRSAFARIMVSMPFLSNGRNEQAPFGLAGFKTRFIRRFFNKATTSSFKKLLRVHITVDEWRMLSLEDPSSCRTVSKKRTIWESFLLSMALACIKDQYHRLDVLQVCASEIINPRNPTRRVEEVEDLALRWMEVGSEIWGSLIAHQNVSATKLLMNEFGLPIEMRMRPDLLVTSELVPMNIEKDVEEYELWTPLMVCCFLGKSKLARFLLDCGADFNTKTNLPTQIFGSCDQSLTPLILSICCPFPYTTDPGPEQNMRTLSGKDEIIRMLLSCGLDLNIPQEGILPLQACFQQDLGGVLDHRYNNTILSTLLNNDASPRLAWPKMDTKSPLHFAIHKPVEEVPFDTTANLFRKLRSRRVYFKMLLEAGCYVNGRDKKGNTPLMSATGEAVLIRYQPYYGYPSHRSMLDDHFRELIKLLAEHGADCDMRDNNGGPSPVMIAAAAGRRDLLKAMLGSGDGDLIEKWLSDEKWWEEKCPGVRKWSYRVRD